MAHSWVRRKRKRFSVDDSKGGVPGFLALAKKGGKKIIKNAGRQF
jgi:hypothetical protein